MLFLGAGASKAVGIGQLSDLTAKVMLKLEKTQYDDVIKDIISELGKKNSRYNYYEKNEIDIEVILSVLNNGINHVNSMRELGPYAIYASDNRNLTLQNRVSNNDLKKIRKIVATEITRNCSKFDEEKANEYYSDLFEIDKEIVDFKTFESTSRTKILSSIATVNYDLVIEKVCDKMGKHLPRGLKSEPGGEGENYLPLRDILFEEHKIHANDKIRYLKLHGSIDWRIRDTDRMIVKRDFPYSLSGSPANEQVMIYPIYEKRLSQEFYFTMYHYFKRLLDFQEIYLIIGYSFRDNSINDAFYNALKNKKSSRMIVVTKNKQVINHVNTLFKEFKRKISIIESKFGDKDLHKKLKDNL